MPSECGLRVAPRGKGAHAGEAGGFSGETFWGRRRGRVARDGARMEMPLLFLSFIGGGIPATRGAGGIQISLRSGYRIDVISSLGAIQHTLAVKNLHLIKLRICLVRIGVASKGPSGSTGRRRGTAIRGKGRANRRGRWPSARFSRDAVFFERQHRAAGGYGQEMKVTVEDMLASQVELHQDLGRK